MAGWPYTIRHPWLDPSVGKRRLADEGDDPSSPVSLPFKRRKYHTLEHGFARLTLNHTPLTSLPSSPDSTNISAPHIPHIPYSPTLNVPLPTPVERSMSPESDVEMDVEFDSPSNSLHGTPSASSAVAASHESQSSKTAEEAEHIKEVEISPIVLGHLKQQTRFPSIIPISSPSTSASSSQALVLYRPLRPPSPVLSSCALQPDNTGDE
ncbi:hypothetical protein J3A83DRAFT_2658538 [Scleroderma citrinum]